MSLQEEAKAKLKLLMKIEDASEATGLSQFYLRRGCKDGSIPHIKAGKVYMINVPALLDKLGVFEEEEHGQEVSDH